MIAALVPVFIIGWLVVGALVVRAVSVLVEEPCPPEDLWWAIPLWPGPLVFALAFWLVLALRWIAGGSA